MENYLGSVEYPVPVLYLLMLRFLQYIQVEMLSSQMEIQIWRSRERSDINTHMYPIVIKALEFDEITWRENIDTEEDIQRCQRIEVVKEGKI